MDLKTLRELVLWLYYQYLLITGIYVLEPWEKYLFNAVLLSVVTMVMYTSYVFVPVHMHLALDFLSSVCGGRSQSTMTLMT